MKKKLLSLILAAVMICTAIPFVVVTAAAEEAEEADGGFLTSR